MRTLFERRRTTRSASQVKVYERCLKLSSNDKRAVSTQSEKWPDPQKLWTAYAQMAYSVTMATGTESNMASFNSKILEWSAWEYSYRIVSRHLYCETQIVGKHKLNMLVWLQTLLKMYHHTTLNWNIKITTIHVFKLWSVGQSRLFVFHSTFANLILFNFLSNLCFIFIYVYQNVCVIEDMFYIFKMEKVTVIYHFLLLFQKSKVVFNNVTIFSSLHNSNITFCYHDRLIIRIRIRCVWIRIALWSYCEYHKISIKLRSYWYILRISTILTL